MLCLLLSVQLLVAPQDTLVLGVEEAVTETSVDDARRLAALGVTLDNLNDLAGAQQ